MCFHKTLTFSVDYQRLFLKCSLVIKCCMLKPDDLKNLQLFLNFTVEFCQTQHTKQLDLDDSQIEK